MPRHMDSEFNIRELTATEQYVNAKEQEQRELAQLQAQAIQARTNGP